eukprot:4876237-Pleurochrysis_carterae.AAC.2
MPMRRSAHTASSHFEVTIPISRARASARLRACTRSSSLPFTATSTLQSLPRLPQPSIHRARIRGRASALAPFIVSSGSLVFMTPPADHVLGSSVFTEATHEVNCAMRVFSTMPSSDDLSASDGVIGTLYTLPPFLSE